MSSHDSANMAPRFTPRLPLSFHFLPPFVSAVLTVLATYLFTLLVSRPTSFGTMRVEVPLASTWSMRDDLIRQDVIVAAFLPLAYYGAHMVV